MAVYSIKDLERLSGIKAHTLRMWEQRYSLLVPQRTKTNIRYYQDNDLKLLLNIVVLNQNGYKISKIASMSNEEIAEKTREISIQTENYSNYLEGLTLAMMELNENKFEKLLNRHTQENGFMQTILELIYPFLDRLRVLWLTGSVNAVQEHFITQLIKRKLIAAIDGIPNDPTNTTPTFILYLPEGDKQELSLLFLHFILRSRNFPVLYLGPDISLDDLKGIPKNKKDCCIFTILSEHFNAEPIQNYVLKLEEVFPQSKIFLSGYQVVTNPLKTKDNTIIVNGLQETLEHIDQINSPSRFSDN